MKFVLAFLCVTLMIQVSLSSQKGRDDDTEDFDKFVANMKNISEKAVTIIKSVLKDIPTTNEYSEYKKHLESYVKKYESLKDTFDRCFPNQRQMADDLNKLLNKVLDLNPDKKPSAEDKKIKQLVDNYDFGKFLNDVEMTIRPLDINKIKLGLKANEGKKCNSSITQPL